MAFHTALPRRLVLIVSVTLLSIAAPIMGMAVAGEPPPPFTIVPPKDHPLVGQAYEPASGRLTDLDEVVARALAADAVLLGETHDNPDHHALQAWMVRRMIAGGRRPAVAFEMIDDSQRDALERHLATAPDDAAGLGAAIGWDKTGWPDWTHYRPIAEAALAAGRAPIPANLSRDDTRALARGDAPDLSAKLGLDRTLDPDMAAAIAEEIKVGHCDMLPEPAVPPMIRIQFARDAVMARALMAGLEEGRQAVLIAGASHIRTDRAVPWHLRQLAPEAAMLSLAFVEIQEDETDPSTYGKLYNSGALPFDVVIFTPRQEREDQCEAFRKHMEKKKG